MKKLIYLMVIIMLMGITSSLLAVNVSEIEKYIVIETANYEVHWNKPAQMGYMQAFVGGGASLINEGGRSFYHSSDYGGWKDWGELQEWEIVEDGPSHVVINYKSADAGTKEYSCIASYYDSVPYIKHEVTITNTGAATPSFASGHDPMFEMNGTNAGIEAYEDPFPHVVYWTADGKFGAIYGPDAGEARNHNTRMDLVHDIQAEDIADGASDTIVYYVAFGEGDAEAAHALADNVQEEPATTPVSPNNSLTTTWGQIRSR
ncbi:hypothetical protein GF312_14200 [Candidatus Poribacteria bacterium]|nr:hypothetical protein [Candidatus Poribacteria bacterium]